MRRTTPISRFRPAMATLLGIVGLSCAGPLLAQQPIVADPPPMPPTEYHLDPPGMEVVDWVTGLEVVWEIRFLPDGRALVTERAGRVRVRVVSPEGRLQDEPWAAPADVFHSGGGGVMGLALHPDVPDEPWVYVMYTLRTDDGPVNRVVRWRDEGVRGMDKEVILDDLPAANTHNGGRIAFGPDGMLYVTVGDTGEAEASQDLDNLRGSILRVTPTGAVPADNPWPESPVWAYGLRNAQGLAFHPETGSFFVADHGPQARDQIHIVEGGRNYGWPRVLGAAGVEGYEDPDERYRPTSKERWFVADDLGDSPMGESASRFGRLRAMAVGPDGALYLGTSNRDRGRGIIRDGDDRIVRIAPR